MFMNMTRYRFAIAGFSFYGKVRGNFVFFGSHSNCVGKKKWV
jgi:hypothetical protein